MSSREAVERAYLGCVLETEPRGPGVGRGREKDSWVDMEVRFGFLGSFCPEDRAGGLSGAARVWVYQEETHLAGPVSFCG